MRNMTPALDTPPASVAATPVRRRWRVYGIVQGVGFRPWLCCTARALDLTGEAGNDAAGVWLEAQGSEAALEALRALLMQAPPRARVEAIVEEPNLTD